MVIKYKVRSINVIFLVTLNIIDGEHYPDFNNIQLLPYPVTLVPNYFFLRFKESVIKYSDFYIHLFCCYGNQALVSYLLWAAPRLGNWS